MPRQNTGLEAATFLSKIIKHIIQSGTIGDTLTTAPTTVGATTVGVAGITNFAAADPAFLVGAAGLELVTLGTPNSTMPIGQTLLVHPTGTRLVEARAIDLGHVSEEGVTWGGTLPLREIRASTSRAPIAYIPEPGELTASWGLLGMNNLNLQAIFGIPEGEAGDGSAATPYGVAINGTNIGTQSALQAFRIEHYRNDGARIWTDLCAAQIDVNVSQTLGASTPAVNGFSIKYTHVFNRIVTAP